MDKSWMNEPRHSVQYRNGVEIFLDFAFRHVATPSGKIVCPCGSCNFRIYQDRDIVRTHLICKGMPRDYVEWGSHGEKYKNRDAQPFITPNQPLEKSFEGIFDVRNLMMDALGFHDKSYEDNEIGDENIDENVNENGDENMENDENSMYEEDPDVLYDDDDDSEEASRFLKFFEKGNQKLYPESTATVLSFTVQLLHLKSYYRWSGVSVGMLLKFLKLQFPNSNIPETLNEAKKLTNALGLGYENIDACPNHCMLYRGERATQEACHICKASRWKNRGNVNDQSQDKKKKKIPCKVFRYFPLIPRLKRLYMSPKTSSSMIWHAEGRTKDGLLRHPADSLAWKEFDKRHPDFARDPRNVRLGLASDGFQPFGMSHPHSIWPVILMAYNLPPWMCMKQSSLILSSIIPGKESVGDKIDIYLQPLIDELLQLWEGVETYDATSKKKFIMRAAIMWTINDFPALANLSGYSTKGEKACPCCANMTESKWLKYGGEYCYLGHRRWLDDSHKFRVQKQYFDGTNEYRRAPKTLSGSEALEQLQGIGFVEEYELNQRNKTSISKQKRKRDESRIDETYAEDETEEVDELDNEPRAWKKKRIFFKLPYWEFNILRHNLDVMHIEKNVCENVLATLLNIKGKSKDNPKARSDLKHMKIRHKLHPVELPNGKVEYPPACYAMTRKEKELFLKVLEDVKVPDGYSSQISSGISLKNGKLQSLKTHDYHVLMQDLFPVALRSSMNKKVAKIIIELSSIFKAVCCKTLNVDELDKVSNRAALVLCDMERCFPPSFFTIMVHLVIHLADEAKLGGPVQFRWMYPIERCLKVFKWYANNNKAHPEGSIAEGYVAQECFTFCSRYFDEIETIFNRSSRNGDIDRTERDKYLLSSGGTFKGATHTIILDPLSLIQAHRYVLMHLVEIDPYIEEFKRYKIQSFPARRYETNPNLLQQLVMKEFHEWFKNHVSTLSNENSPELIKCLATGPSNVVKSFKGFVSNGRYFRTKEASKEKISQNYGVVVKSITSSVSSSRDSTLIEIEHEYFGELTDIIELNYSARYKVVLFHCNWADIARDKGVKKDEFGLTMVNFSRLSNTGDNILHEPFVIPSQVQQVFYVKDPLNPTWKNVIKVTPRDVYDIGKDWLLSTEENIIENNTENDATMFERNDPYDCQDLDERDWTRDDIDEDLFSDVLHQL